ncbi:hypothetical protein [Chromobacterium sp. Panama]|uniref:hypothetical protein n=1 Tax=Chromobacterium sp. Panama TaxID=2161826 RepID=UPI001304FC07|nr:hypothetical protein [Chromobacterium sp. Panama]
MSFPITAQIVLTRYADGNLSLEHHGDTVRMVADLQAEIERQQAMQVSRLR